MTRRTGTGGGVSRGSPRPQQSISSAGGGDDVSDATTNIRVANFSVDDRPSRKLSDRQVAKTIVDNAIAEVLNSPKGLEFFGNTKHLEFNKVVVHLILTKLPSLWSFDRNLPDTGELGSRRLSSAHRALHPRRL